MTNPARNHVHPSRRETLRTIGVAAAVAAVLFLATTPFATGSTVRVDGGGGGAIA